MGTTGETVADRMQGLLLNLAVHGARAARVDAQIRTSAAERQNLAAAGLGSVRQAAIADSNSSGAYESALSEQQQLERLLALPA